MEKGSENTKKTFIYRRLERFNRYGFPGMQVIPEESLPLTSSGLHV
jgi:hypothetical protein